MQRDVLQSFVRIGIFVGGGGLILLLIEPRQSPEWIVSLCSAVVGAALILGALVVGRVMK